MGNQLILSFIVALFLFHSVAAIGFDPVPFFTQFFLPPPAFGPDSIGFAKNDPGTAYVSISDGRILKLTVSNGAFSDFSFTAPGRNKAVCDGTVNPVLAPTCGRVFGLSVDNFYQVVYLTDVNLGLFLVPLATGGQATLVTNTAGGLPLKFPDGVDVDPINSDVYFTDASQTLNYTNIIPFTPATIGTLDSTGRLIKFNPRTGQVTVLLTGLAFPTGPAVSSDGAFVLIPQIGPNNILRYFIRGPLAGTPPQVLLTLPGVPLQIKRASTPLDFWVGVNQPVGQVFQPIGYRFDGLSGRVRITKDFSPQYPNTVVSSIQETNPFTVYVGTVGTNYVTQYHN